MWLSEFLHNTPWTTPNLNPGGYVNSIRPIWILRVNPIPNLNPIHIEFRLVAVPTHIGFRLGVVQDADWVWFRGHFDSRRITVCFAVRQCKSFLVQRACELLQVKPPGCGSGGILTCSESHCASLPSEPTTIHVVAPCNDVCVCVGLRLGVHTQSYIESVNIGPIFRVSI